MHILLEKPNSWVNMKVCEHRGLVIAVLTRNEHCPPHVHVGTDKWNARFEFSFWHQGVRLWDVVPLQSQPTATLLEELRQVIKQPGNLRKARVIWWNVLHSVCLVNQLWDSKTEEVISPKTFSLGARAIQAACFDEQGYKTILQLAGQNKPLEIEL